MVWSAQLRNRERDPRLRELLDAVYAYERSDAVGHDTHRTLDQPPRSEPTDAITIWQAVVAGRWSLLEQFDSDGARCFVARQNHPDVPGSPALSERERQIVAHASRGFSNKHIAYELGLCSSTVAAQLTSAARKLGVSSRETLLHAFAVLGGAPDRSVAGDDAGSTAQRHDDDPTIRVVRFRHDDHDYAMIRIAITPRLPSSLTTAEAAVATLAIEGLSNAAIARKRKTSVRTVANQLRSIYAKLAVGSRRQLRSRFSVQRVAHHDMPVPPQ
jgi:DNA-binding NarL/FixJ family response regulator